MGCNTADHQRTSIREVAEQQNSGLAPVDGKLPILSLDPAPEQGANPSPQARVFSNAQSRRTGGSVQLPYEFEIELVQRQSRLENLDGTDTYG